MVHLKKSMGFPHGTTTLGADPLDQRFLLSQMPGLAQNQRLKIANLDPPGKDIIAPHFLHVYHVGLKSLFSYQLPRYLLTIPNL